MIKWIILAIFVISHFTSNIAAKVRHSFYRQFFDHSTLFAPINFLMYILQRYLNQLYIDTQHFKDLKVLDENWEMIRDEAKALYDQGGIKASSTYNDLGFNSFFKTGWKRFYLKWYESSHPSAAELCPNNGFYSKHYQPLKRQCLQSLFGQPFGQTPWSICGVTPLSFWALITPNDDRCFIDVDGERYSWRDGQSVVFDETYIHYVENKTDQNRIIFFADVERPMKVKWMERFNHWFGRNVMTAASSPNETGDQTGGLNKAFGYVYQIRIKAKSFKS